MGSFQNKLNRAMKNYQGSWMSVYSIFFFSMFNRLYDVSGTKNNIGSARLSLGIESGSGVVPVPAILVGARHKLSKYSSQSRINTGIYYASRMNRERSSDNLSHPPLTSPSGNPDSSSTMAGGARGIYFRLFLSNAINNQMDYWKWYQHIHGVSKTVCNFNPLTFFNSFFSNRQTMKTTSDIRQPTSTMVPYPFRP